MPTQPKTKLDEVSARLDATLKESGTFLNRPAMEMEVARLRRSIGDVVSVNPLHGELLQIQLAAALNDQEFLVNKLRVENASRERFEVIGHLAGAFLQIGKFTTAADILRRLLQAESGSLSVLSELAIQAGLFFKLDEELERAVKLQINLADDGAVLHAHEIARVLRNNGVTEENVLEQLDLVGQVFQEHNRPVTAQSVIFGGDGEDIHTLALEVRVDAPVEELWAMNLDFATLMIKKKIVPSSNFSIHFSTGANHE